LASGNYYVGWLIDSDGEVNESDETNNTIYKPSPKLAVCGPCTYSISSSSHNFSASSGSYSFNVTTSRSDCAWTAQKDVSWITITSGGSGPGSKTLHYQVAANTGNQRSGHITVEGKTHTVTQDVPACTYSISSSGHNFGASGGSYSFTVTTSRTDCAWTAQKDVSWITITSGGSGPGSKTLHYQVTANTGNQRIGHITIEGKTHTVTQDAPACTYSISSSSHNFGALSGSYSFNVTTSRTDCAWTAQKDEVWITITSGGSGPGNKTLHYQVTANTGNQRTGHITIEGKTHTVTQAGLECPACTPDNPSPANNATGISTTATLQWGCSGGNGADSYDVYFGTSTSPGKVGNTTSTSYNPGTLQSCTDYYWKVVAKKTSCNDVSGPEWHFKTVGCGTCDDRFQRTMDMCVVPGGTFNVQVTLQFDESFTGLVLDEQVPSGWTVTPVDNGGATYKPSSVEWLWISVAVGDTKTVTYAVTVPQGTSLGMYTVSGMVKSSSPALSAVVCGNTEIEVADSCGKNIAYTVAHWVGSTTDGSIDPSDPCEISTAQILVAIPWWALPDAADPDLADIVCSNDWPISTDEILALIPFWAQETCIDDPACQDRSLKPRNGSAAATATRVIDPDSVDAVSGGTVEVAVSITAQEAITGLVLDEQIPSGWTVTPVDNGGATYKPSSVEWLWISVTAGETKTVTYDVQIPAGETPDTYTISGVVKSGMPPFENSVVGENTVDVVTGDGLQVHVQDIAGNPIEGACAFAMTHTGDTPPQCGWGYEAGTDASGNVTLDVDPGTYTLIVSSAGAVNFLVVREGVTAPGAVTVDPTGTVLVNITAKKVDGAPLQHGSVYIQPFCWAKRVGSTGETGSSSFLVTPGVYNVFVWWGDPYYIYQRNVDLTTPTSVALDASQMSVGSVSVSITSPEKFSYADVTLWPEFVWTSPCIGIYPSGIIHLNSGTYDMGGCVFAPDGDDTWYFRMDLGEVSITANQQATRTMGGNVVCNTSVGASSYTAGDVVTIQDTLTDAHGNRLTSMSRTAGVESLAGKYETLQRLSDQPVDRVISRELSDVFPHMAVTDPLGSVIYETANDWPAWNPEHTFQLAPNAPEGTYTVTLSLDTGPLQGVISDTSTFCVGECGDGCWSQGTIQIQASGSGSDTSNWFGVDPNGTECFDSLDIPEPPTSPSPYTSLWFTLDLSCSDTTKYTKDIRASVNCNEVEAWTMKVADEGDTQQVSLSWDPQQLPPAGGCSAQPPRVTLLDTVAGVSVDMRAATSYTYTKQSNPETRTFTIRVDCGSCQELCTNLTPTGWHMMTLPGDLCETEPDLVSALSDDINPCYIFRYDPSSGGYVMAPPAENISYEAGMGFWVRTYEDLANVCADVNSKTEKTCIPLQTGWNQIGNPFNFEVALSNVTVKYQGNEVSLSQAQQNGWVSAYLFGYDTTASGYGMLDPANGQLEPWTGYWMRAYVDCEVCISPIPAPPPPPTQSVLLKPQALGLSGISMPPSPPNFAKQLDEDVLSQLGVSNVPNPIRSRHTTTFKVEGKGAVLVQAIRVEIYNQAGQKVFTQDINAKELEWHTNNDTGELLANGVYLYQVWVKIADTWYPTGVHKLAVVR